MPLQPDQKIWDILDPQAIHDPDMTPMSVPEIQQLFAKDTVATLRDKLGSLQVIQCESAHDDPCSGIDRVTCPLRELNLACAHQDFIRTSRPVSIKWQTPLSAIMAACHALSAVGHGSEAERLISEAKDVAHRLYVADAGAYLTYHRLREGRVLTREDLVHFPAEGWSHPFASIDSIDELKARARKTEAELGAEMEAIKDEVLVLLETAVSTSDLQSASVVA